MTMKVAMHWNRLTRETWHFTTASAGSDPQGDDGLRGIAGQVYAGGSHDGAVPAPAMPIVVVQSAATMAIATFAAPVSSTQLQYWMVWIWRGEFYTPALNHHLILSELATHLYTWKTTSCCYKPCRPSP